MQDGVMAPPTRYQILSSKLVAKHQDAVILRERSESKDLRTDSCANLASMHRSLDSTFVPLGMTNFWIYTSNQKLNPISASAGS